LAKGKTFFIKYDVSRNIETTGQNIKTFEILVHITITKEYTTDRSKLKFVSIIGTKIWPTCTHPNTQK
jgi:hypothetical protein